MAKSIQVQLAFGIETIDGSRLGKLRVPLNKASDWLNFLVSPRQQAQILSSTQSKDTLTLYFQANESLYAYLDGRCNCQVGTIHPEAMFVGKALQH